MTPRRTARLALLAAAGAALALPATAAEPVRAPAYQPAGAGPIGAPDRWDYASFDPASGRVFVAHADRLAVLDGRTGALIGEVQGIEGGTHGSAAIPALGKGYTDDGRRGEAVAFDLKTLKVLARVKIDPDADGLAYDPASRTVLVVEGDPGVVAVIDPKTDAVVGRIQVGGKLESGAPDGLGHFFVDGEEKREVVRIDTRTRTVEARYPVPDCASPHGLAVDPRRGRVYATCVNQKMVVLDARTGKILADVPIGRGSDFAAVDVKRGLAFSSDGVDGIIDVVAETAPGAFARVATVPTAVSGRTMTVDPASGRLYVPAADVTPNPAGGRPKPTPGSLKLLMFDPR